MLKKRKNKSKNNVNEKLNKYKDLNSQIKLMNTAVFNLPKNELINTYIQYAQHHSNPLYRDIDLKMNFISITIKIAFSNSNPYSSLFGYIRDENTEPNFYINLIKYTYNQDIALITEATSINKDNMILNIEPLKSLIYLSDLLDLDLAFPAYTNKKDPQEKLFKSLGFEESILKADEGQKILLRKAKKVDL